MTSSSMTSYVMGEQQHKNQKALAMDLMSSVMSLRKTEIVQKSELEQSLFKKV